MHYLISATMRITLGKLLLLGACLFVLLGLLRLIRELFADEHPQAPALGDHNRGNQQPVSRRLFDE